MNLLANIMEKCYKLKLSENIIGELDSDINQLTRIVGAELCKQRQNDYLKERPKTPKTIKAVVGKRKFGCRPLVCRKMCRFTSNEQVNAQSSPLVSREMLLIHCHAWRCLSIVMLACASSVKRFSPKTVNENKLLCGSFEQSHCRRNQHDLKK